MARRRDFARGAAAISRRRETLWFDFQPTAFTMTAAGGTLIFNLNAAALALRPFTIVRTHLEIALRSDQAAAIETQTAALALAVVSDQASAIGVTALPTPITDMGSDLWFLYQLMFADESNLTDRTRNGQFYSVDSKAMRKVEDGQDIVMVAEQAITNGVEVSVGGRLLIKLH